MEEQTNIALSDADWVRGLKANDEAAKMQLWMWLHTLANSKKYRRDDKMKDAAATAVLSAYERVLKRGAFQFKFNSKFKWYCATIFANEANRVLKKRGLMFITMDDSFQIVDENALSEFDSVADSQQIEARIQPCLKGLSSRATQILHLLYKDAVNPGIVAEHLGN